MNALKAVRKTDDQLVVENYIVLFGGRDLEGAVNDNRNPDGSVGEFFTKSTDLRSAYTNTGRLYVDWEHGFADGDEPNADEPLGFVDWTTAKADDTGVRVQRILDRRAAFVRMIEPLIDEGMIGTSSEAVPQKVRKADTGEILRWPLRRDTLTVTPMEPRMLSENAMRAVKALADKMPALKSLLPEHKNEKAQLFDVSGNTNTGVMVALYPPADVAAQIAAMSGVEVSADELHVTLAYYGDANNLTSAQIAAVIDKVRNIGFEFAPIKGRFGGVGRFSASESSDNMDVLYANVDSPSIETLRISLVERLYQLQPVTNHGFTPHMTLAYVPVNADMPITNWTPIPVTFDAISIVVGDKREDFLLTGYDRNVVATDKSSAVKSPPSTGDPYLATATIQIDPADLAAQIVERLRQPVEATPPAADIDDVEDVHEDGDAESSAPAVEPETAPEPEDARFAEVLGEFVETISGQIREAIES